MGREHLATIMIYVQENKSSTKKIQYLRQRITHDTASPRQVRHLDFVGQFSTKIFHLSGKENVVVDALSRLEAINCPDDVNYNILAEEQRKDPELKINLRYSSKKHYSGFDK